MTQIRIGPDLVGLGAPCYVIGEIGINHNGSIDIALELIRKAASAGVQAVKFQKRDVPVVYPEKERQTPREFDRSFVEHAVKRARLEGVTYPVFPEMGQLERMQSYLDGADVQLLNGDLKYALEFGPKEWDMIRQTCEECGVAWGVSAWDGLSVHEIDGFHPDFHKIASACLPHRDLLERVRRCGRPVILSTGGSTMEQVKEAVHVLGRENLIILHCTATYPCSDEDANIAVIDTLREAFHDVPIGYSGHESDLLASELAVSRGACVVERHITLDHTMPGSDQKASIEPEKLRLLVDAIRSVETRRGTQNYLEPEKWADEADMSRIQTLLGNSEKQVLPCEVSVMEKLRRVTDF